MTKNNTKIHFYGGTETVTGSNFLIEREENGSRFRALIDCGFFQGGDRAEKENAAPFPYDPASIDYVFVTHAHIDHIGRIPALVRDGFSGAIISTGETMQIAPLMFEDALSVAKSRGADALYGREDVEKTMSLWRRIDYREEMSIGNISVSFLNSGHILGSAMLVFSAGGKKLVFTGDLGNLDNPILSDPEALPKTDFLVMESVYGDRNHENAENRLAKLKKAVERTVAKNGTLIIPTFSLERTQNLLFELNKMAEDGLLPELPVFLDSPLAIKLTEIYEKHPERFNAEVLSRIKKGDNVFDFPNLRRVMSHAESEKIYEEPNPKIILAGSGMSAGGRVVRHEKKYLGDARTTLLFVGYQSAGSLGRQIEEGMKKIFVEGEAVKIEAEIMKIEGYSSHMDGEHLLEFVEKAPPGLQKIFVVMGEPKASNFLAQRIRDNLDLDSEVPNKNSVYEIKF